MLTKTFSGIVTKGPYAGQVFNLIGNGLSQEGDQWITVQLWDESGIAIRDVRVEDLQ